MRCFESFLGTKREREISRNPWAANLEVHACFQAENIIVPVSRERRVNWTRFLDNHGRSFSWVAAITTHFFFFQGKREKTFQEHCGPGHADSQSGVVPHGQHRKGTGQVQDKGHLRKSFLLFFSVPWCTTNGTSMESSTTVTSHSISFLGWC
jgi:hypothetical protein